MWKSFFAGMSRMSRTQKTCLILISPSRRYGFNSDSAQRIIGDHNATAQELSTFTLGLQWCSALCINREGFGVGSERDAVGQTLGVLVWLHCLVHGLSCFFKNNWGWSERSRFFFKFLSTADPRIKACSWSCASYKLRHLLPLVVANC